jgi:UDP-N-acetylglucosamine 1-carboxyvinyltransferase
MEGKLTVVEKGGNSLTGRNTARYVIDGGRPLNGEVTISGAKNAATKLIIASLISNDVCTIENVPRIRDVELTLNICEALGCAVDWIGESTLEIDSRGMNDYRIPLKYSGAMRTSVLFVAPLLIRMGVADLRTVGGCNLGKRPIDYHIDGLEQLGVQVAEEENAFHFKASSICGTTVELAYPSVGTTEQLLIASAGAIGRTVIRNAAIEPEIQNLVGFLQSMGAIVYQDECRTWIVDGVDEFRGCSYSVTNDRIEAASFGALAVATGGNIFVRGAEQEHLITFLNMLRKAGGEFDIDAEGIRFYRKNGLHPVIAETDVHPGFMTDWQPPFTLLLTQAEGVSIVHETVYEHRFGFVEAIQNMGANIQLHTSCLGNKTCRFLNCHFDHSAIISGPAKLSPGEVEIPDLRAGFAYLMAALLADGTSRIGGIENVKRGYSYIKEKIEAIGGSIREES